MSSHKDKISSRLRRLFYPLSAGWLAAYFDSVFGCNICKICFLRSLSARFFLSMISVGNRKKNILSATWTKLRCCSCRFWPNLSYMRSTQTVTLLLVFWMVARSVCWSYYIIKARRGIYLLSEILITPSSELYRPRTTFESLIVISSFKPLRSAKVAI